MKLKPLQQWICDTCGEIIEKPEDGYVQFKYNMDTQKYDDFIIVHHMPASPRKDNHNGCYRYNSDLDLKTYLGENGVAWLLSYIDVGQHIQPNHQGTVCGDYRKWVEFFRRLQIPYYEEARLYWNKAEQDGYFESANEVWPYLPKNLKRLIDLYK